MSMSDELVEHVICALAVTPIVLAAIIYFLLLWPLVRLLSRLENRALAGRR